MYNYNVATTSVIFSQPLGHSLNQAVSQPVNEWGLQTIRKHTCLLSYQIQRNTPLCPAGAECYRVKSHAYRSCRNQPKHSHLNTSNLNYRNQSKYTLSGCSNSKLKYRNKWHVFMSSCSWMLEYAKESDRSTNYTPLMLILELGAKTQSHHTKLPTRFVTSRGFQHHTP